MPKRRGRPPKKSQKITKNANQETHQVETEDEILLKQEVECQTAAVRAICNLEIKDVLSLLRSIRSKFNDEQLQIPVLEEPFDTQMFEQQGTLQTPGVNNNRLSVGMTTKTLRLPKTGEMLLSVHGSPLGVFKEDNMEPIDEAVCKKSWFGYNSSASSVARKVKMHSSKTCEKIAGRGIKFNYDTLSNLPSTLDLANDDDFESPIARTISYQPEITRIIRSQTKKVDNLVKNIKPRTKKCGRPEKAKVGIELVDEDDAAKKNKKKKVVNVAEGSSLQYRKHKG